MGLTNIARLHEELGRPLDKFQTVHVAGTNGKGSVCWKVASALQRSGCRTGLFMSPHISSYRERMRINGELIDKADVERLLPMIGEAAAANSIPASFFEYTTMLGLLHFAEKGAEVVVLETGLGGRLDSTNICSPVATAITSVSMDHASILGDTVEAIATEKAGIMKPNIPVIVGPNAPQDVLQTHAKAMKSPFISVPPISSPNANASLLDDNEEKSFDFDLQNTEIARTLIKSAISNGLHFKSMQSPMNVHSAAVNKGLNSRPPCRFEKVKTPLAPDIQVILDVAHNEDGMAALIRKIETDFLKSQSLRPSVRLVVGFSEEKAIGDCLQQLLSIAPASQIHFVQSKHGRSTPAPVLEEQLMAELAKQPKSVSSSGIELEQVYFPQKESYTVEEVLQSALNKAQEAKEKGQEEIILICGSVYLMGEVKEALHVPVEIDSIQKL
eukprot:g6078.t1